MIMMTCLKKNASLFAIYCLNLLSWNTLRGDILRPRGVDPDHFPFYDPNRDFQCLDGTATIPFSAINDDYCDCPDGSDEPGTSACPNGRFFCPNLGHKSSTVFSSRVNDYICDCCDGSDEWGTVELGTTCKNTCLEAGAAERAEAERLAVIVRDGLKIKSEMSQRGKEVRAQQRQEAEEKRAEIDKLKAERDVLQPLKDDAEAKEKTAQDAHLERKEQERLAREEEEKARERKEAEDVFDLLDADKDGILTRGDLRQELKFDQNNDGLVEDEEAEFFLSGHKSYNKETFLDIGWPLINPVLQDKPEEVTDDIDQDEFPVADDELTPHFESEVDVDKKNMVEEHSISEEESEDDDLEEEGDEEDDYDYNDRDLTDREYDFASKRHSLNRHHQDPVVPSPDDKDLEYTEELKSLVNAANAIRKEYNDVDKKVRDLESQVEAIDNILSKDYGPVGEFASLIGECFEHTDHEYTYKMCIFDFCSQRPRSGGAETRLGMWERWSGDAGDPYTQMTYGKGQQCWNGPGRSTKVDLRCGLTNTIVAASEPNRCEYHFIFETPAICKATYLQEEEKPTHDEL